MKTSLVLGKQLSRMSDDLRVLTKLCLHWSPSSLLNDHDCIITAHFALQACALLNFGETTTKAGLILGWATSLAMLGYYFKRALDTSETLCHLSSQS